MISVEKHKPPSFPFAPWERVGFNGQIPTQLERLNRRHRIGGGWGASFQPSQLMSWEEHNSMKLCSPTGSPSSLAGGCSLNGSSLKLGLKYLEL